MTPQELQAVTTRLDSWRLYFQGRLSKPRAAMTLLNGALAKNEKTLIVQAVEQVQHELIQAVERGEISSVSKPDPKISVWKIAENLRFTISTWMSNLQTRIQYPESLRKGLVSAFEKNDGERIDDFLVRITQEFKQAVERHEIPE